MKRLFFLFLLLLTAVVFFAACGGDTTTGESEGPSTTEGRLWVFMTDGRSDYTVITPYEDSNAGKEALTRFQDYVSENSGTPFAYASDKAAPATLEILLGAVDREETRAVLADLRVDEYIICVKNGKLIAVGGSDEASAAAVVRLAKMYFSAPQRDLVLREGTIYAHTVDYPVGNVMLGDTPLKDFVLSYQSGAEADANRVAEALVMLYGRELPVVEEAEAAGKQVYFAIDGPEDKWSFSLAGDVFTVKGGSETMLAYAASHFLDTLKTLSAPMEDGFTASGGFEAGADLRLFDLNVYFSGYAENSVANRYPRLLSLIEAQNPDILTLQDVSPTWLALMKAGSGNAPALTDSYDYVGVGRNNDADSVMHPIFYKKDKYTLKDSGVFWLSETPEWESVGWDGYTRCICTWALLEDKSTGAVFAVMNTQFDIHGIQAQTKGGALVAERAKAFGVPVIFGGDFRATRAGRAYRALGDFLLDSVNFSERAGDASAVTVNNAFGETSTARLATDFVMLSRGDFRVHSHTTLTDLVDGAYASNHWPLVVDLTVKK